MRYYEVATGKTPNTVEVSQALPNISIGQNADLTSFGYLPLIEAAAPAAQPGHRVVEGTPAQVDGQWTVTWVQEPLAPEVIMAGIVEATQKRLDDFAKTRNYDGILSACTYATSAIPKFQTEGQYCVGARDATWAALYQILADVQAGTRTMPTGYADIEPDLPVLAWPA